ALGSVGGGYVVEAADRGQREHHALAGKPFRNRSAQGTHGVRIALLDEGEAGIAHDAGQRDQFLFHVGRSHVRYSACRCVSMSAASRRCARVAGGAVAAAISASSTAGGGAGNSSVSSLAGGSVSSKVTRKPTR